MRGGNLKPSDRLVAVPVNHDSWILGDTDTQTGTEVNYPSPPPPYVDYNNPSASTEAEEQVNEGENRVEVTFGGGFRQGGNKNEEDTSGGTSELLLNFFTGNLAPRRVNDPSRRLIDENRILKWGVIGKSFSDSQSVFLQFKYRYAFLMRARIVFAHKGVWDPDKILAGIYHVNIKPQYNLFLGPDVS